MKKKKKLIRKNGRIEIIADRKYIGANKRSGGPVEEISIGTGFAGSRGNHTKLKLEDIRQSIETIPTQNALIGGVPTLEHDLFTNGIALCGSGIWYRACAGRASALPSAYGQNHYRNGSRGFTYEEIAKPHRPEMGGLGYDLATGFSADAGTSWQKMVFSFSALYRNLPEAINIVSDIICAGDLSQEARDAGFDLREKE